MAQFEHPILANLKARIDHALTRTGDPEGFHCEEDAILRDALRYIAAGERKRDGRPSAREVAKACMRLVNLSTTRWYA